MKHFLVAGFLVIMSNLANAQVLLPQDKAYMGLLAGYNTTTDLDGRFAFGAEGGLHMTNNVKGVLFFLSSKIGRAHV